jgi:hypothetical protein
MLVLLWQSEQSKQTRRLGFVADRTVEQDEMRGRDLGGRLSFSTHYKGYFVGNVKHFRVCLDGSRIAELQNSCCFWDRNKSYVSKCKFTVLKQ